VTGDDTDLAEAAARYFRDLQARICTAFEALEPEARFEARDWRRPNGHRLEGGGDSRLMRGQVFEKVGVNFSHVWGVFSDQARAQIPGAQDSGGRFLACGISLVAHMANPYVPTVHMNLRYLRTSRGWFGGGSDLTPTFPFEEDTAQFHAALRRACETYRPGAYEAYKAWCDRYFYLPHRHEPRGVGGIFFDELASGDAEADFAFVRQIGEAFLEVYPTLVSRRKDTPYDEADREKLLYKRGRYVEFNLVYDRGTRFGFQTDADPEAYLMSLPPLVKW
jgi:coproporphyrinogen III oxidase